MVIAIVMAGFAAAFVAAGAAFVIGSPVWYALGVAIACGNIATLLAAAGLFLHATSKGASGASDPDSGPTRRRAAVTREEAEETLNALGLPPPLERPLRPDRRPASSMGSTPRHLAARRTRSGPRLAQKGPAR